MWTLNQITIDSTATEVSCLTTSRYRTSHPLTLSPHFFTDLAELCERVIETLFGCPLDSTSASVEALQASSKSSNSSTPRLSEFIAYALHRTRLPLAVTHQALFLLKRLKSRFPAARGSSGHRLFISALMLASKSSCDDTYSNKSWTIVGQGLFSLREVNQMERELFGYLGFKVNVEPEDLDDFVFGLEQGRIHAPIEPTTPDIKAIHLQRTATQEDVSMAQDGVEQEQDGSDEGLCGLSPTTPERSQFVPPHPRYNNRASIDGYPSMGSQRMVSATPMAAAATACASAPSLDRYLRSQNYPQHDAMAHVRASTAPVYQRAGTPSSSSSSSMHASSVPMAPSYNNYTTSNRSYNNNAYVPFSPSQQSHMSSTRGSFSYGSMGAASTSLSSSSNSSARSSSVAMSTSMSMPASVASGCTTPETPASQFVSTPGDWECANPMEAAAAGQTGMKLSSASHFQNTNPFAAAAEASQKANAMRYHGYQDRHIRSSQPQA